MAFIPESPVWEEGVRRFEIDDYLQGATGNDLGVDNIPLQQLANRTVFLNRQVAMLKGRGGYLSAHDFGTLTPTQQMLTNYALAEIGITDQLMIFNNTRVKNLFDGYVWVLNNTPDSDPPVFEWVNDGPDIVNPDLSMLHSASVEGYGRNLLDILGVTTIQEASIELQRRCNNSGQIDNSGIPDFSDLMIGDYIDGLDLSGIAAPTGGDAPQAWNENYKNNRIVIAGFNTYKRAGDTVNAKNHILFSFRHNIARSPMNPTNDNTGGYQASALRVWLEGATGDGSGIFATALKQKLGDVLYTIRKAHSKKSDYAWGNYTVFIPSEIEMFGVPYYGDEGVYMAALTSPVVAQRVGYTTNVQFPLFQDSTIFRVADWNGARTWRWLSTPSASSSAHFCGVGNYGHSSSYYASSVGGVAPAFCVA
ncbi:MAG: DUF6273 domain-containing protein [Treponema sp.]|nr:DUF6273 domain-containing protein [Treponema sp.]